jgi:alkylation response protein AidB-like acyl-CoA dehydrogenase
MATRATTQDITITTDAQGHRILTHPDADSITREVLVERAKAMVPELKERAPHTDAARRMLPETVQMFTDAGFFRIVQPRRYGGFELGVDVLEEVVIEVARGCGSSAWCLAILGGHTWWSGLFEEAGQDLLFGDDGHVIMATNLSGNGRCRRVEGGFELSGRFVYLSGCDVSNWLCVGAMLEEDGVAPQDAPWFYLAIRPQDVEIVDDWYMLGLRGTGSKTVLADKVFVPQCLALSQAAIAAQEAPGRYVHQNPLYGAPMLAFLSIETTGAAVGIAQQAVDILEDIARTKPVRTREAGLTGATQSSLPSFRRHLAEAKSMANAARVLLLDEARRLASTMQEYAPQGRKLAPDEIVEYGLNSARLVDLCVQAVDHCFAAAGTSATFEGQPMERCWRDMHMLSTHNVYRLDLMGERWATAYFEASQVSDPAVQLPGAGAR